MKSVTIDRYTTITDFTTAGSGSATWCFARDTAGNEVFLKKFLTPVFPDPSLELPERVRKGRINTCLEFNRKKKAVYDAVRRAANNNIIIPHEIFQYEGHYYVVSDRVRMEDMNIETVSRLPQDNVIMLMRVMAHCLMQLEEQGVVHADLKPDNFLLKKTEGGKYTLKLIDFDASYLVSDPPTPGEEIQCDTVYIAPETLQFMLEEPVKLTTKVDVFAFAILMHQMLTGHLPGFDSKYDSVCHAVLDGGKVGVDSTLPEPYRALITCSLHRDPAKRPTMKEIQKALLTGEFTYTSSGSSSSSTTGTTSGSASGTASGSTTGSTSGSASGRVSIFIHPSLRPHAKAEDTNTSTPSKPSKYMKRLKDF